MHRSFCLIPWDNIRETSLCNKYSGRGIFWIGVFLVIYAIDYFFRVMIPIIATITESEDTFSMCERNEYCLVIHECRDWYTSCENCFICNRLHQRKSPMCLMNIRHDPTDIV